MTITADNLTAKHTMNGALADDRASVRAWLGDAPIGPVLRELREVRDLPDGHPRRIAAVAAKDAAVAACQAYEAALTGAPSP